MNNKVSEDIIMLGSYPFYLKQAPYDQLLASLDRNSKRIHSALGEDCLEMLHIGSTAIKGIPGTPIIDILAVCRSLDAPDVNQIKRLEANGFEDKGKAPHTSGDSWFYGGDPSSQPGTMGRAVVHIVAQGNPFIEASKAFVNYCNAVPSAFNRYSNIKLEGAKLALNGEEGQKLSEYKQYKVSVVNDLMKEARNWVKTNAAQ